MCVVVYSLATETLLLNEVEGRCTLTGHRTKHCGCMRWRGGGDVYSLILQNQALWLHQVDGGGAGWGGAYSLILQNQARSLHEVEGEGGILTGRSKKHCRYLRKRGGGVCILTGQRTKHCRNMRWKGGGGVYSLATEPSTVRT